MKEKVGLCHLLEDQECNDMGTGGSGGVHLLMSDERIPVRCLLLSQVVMKHVISWDGVLEKKGDV